MVSNEILAAGAGESFPAPVGRQDGRWRQAVASHGLPEARPQVSQSVLWKVTRKYIESIVAVTVLHSLRKETEKLLRTIVVAVSGCGIACARLQLCNFDEERSNSSEKRLLLRHLMGLEEAVAIASKWHVIECGVRPSGLGRGCGREEGRWGEGWGVERGGEEVESA